MRALRIIPRRLLLASLAVVAVQATGTLHAQQPVPPPSRKPVLNFVYAARLGTGAYEVAGRRVYIMRFPVSFKLKKPEKDSWGVRFKLPVTLGFVDFYWNEFLSDFDLPDSVATASLVPGFEFKIPIGKYWTLKPYAEFGAGRDFDEGQLTWIYAVGTKSRLDFPFGDLIFSVGNEIYWAASNPQGAPSHDGFMTFKTGVAIQHPLGFSVKGREQFFSVFFVHELYIKELKFERLEEDPTLIENIFEFGFAFGMQPPAKLLKIKIPQIGISFAFGENAFRAVKFSMGFRF